VVRARSRAGTVAPVLVVLSAAFVSTACNTILGLPDVPMPVEDGGASGADLGDASRAADASIPGDASTLGDGAPAKDATVGTDAGSEASITVGFDDAADAPGTVTDGGPRPPEAGACDTQNDPHNCGVCGHDCLGGQCSASACQPFALWPGDSGATGQPYALAEDDAYLYWIDISNRNVLRTDKTSGATNDLLPSSFTAILPLTIAVDDAGAVYWGDQSEIWRCAKSGCTSDPVAVTSTGPSGVYSLAVDDVAVYWSENSTEILSAHKFGTNESPSVIWQSDASVNANAVATDGTRVYFTAEDGLLRGIPLDGGAQFSIGSTGSAESLGIVLKGGAAYWTIADTAHGEVIGASTTSLGPYPIADEQQFPTWLAVDGTSVFWFTSALTGSSTINGCALNDCTPTPLATSPSPHAIVVDDTAIYWSDPNALGPFGGAIFKLAK
jgi:hypothetical protein